MMKNIISVWVILLLFQGIAFSQGTPGLAFGGPDDDAGLTLCKAHGGGYAIAGYTRSFGAGSSDFFFLVLDTGGQVIVNKTYGWSHHDVFRRILPTDTGYLFIGDNWDYGPGRLDIFMMLSDASGTQTKKYWYGTLTRENGFDVLPLDDGFLILGHSRLQNPKGDIYLVKANLNGEVIWQKSFSDEGNDYAFKIINSSQDDGYVFIGSKNGFFDDLHGDFQTHDADILLIKTDRDGNQVWKQTYGESEHDFGYGLCNAPDGGYYLVGSSQSYGHGSFDMLLIKTDSEGNELWHKAFGGSGYEYGKSIAIDPDGNLYLSGTSESFGTGGTPDLYIVKTDADGNELWSETVGGNKNDFGEEIIALGETGCALTGRTQSFGEGGNDLYFIRLTSDGKIDIFTTIKPNHFNKVKFYPNPMASKGTFEIPGLPLSHYQIALYDASGRTVNRFDADQNKINIDRGHLKSGTYFYRIQNKENPQLYYSGKIIVR